MNEKMRILDMLEKGTITPDDAVKLMEAVGPSRPPFINPQTRANMDERFQKFTKDVHIFAKDVGCKAQEFYKDVEPKVKKATQTALERTAAVLDSLAKKLNESLESCECDDPDCDDPDCDCKKTDDDKPVPN